MPTDADDPRLQELVSDLIEGSARFRELWARQDVAPPSSGQSVLRHPSLGRLILNINTFQVPGAGGATLVVYHAPAGSSTSEALAQLAAIEADSGDAGPAH